MEASGESKGIARPLRGNLSQNKWFAESAIAAEYELIRRKCSMWNKTRLRFVSIAE
jgi:hypothetical protein